MFATSMTPPLALGFFGLGVGYLIWGPQELLGFPRRDASVDRAMGAWGIFMPGFCQFVAGTILFIGLTWFDVFKEKPLYMAALAFSAYGIHWFVLGYNRYRGNDPRPNVGMSFGFTILSALGATVFFHGGDWPVGVLFLGLCGVYITEFFVSIPIPAFERLLGFFHTITGLWLMYLTFIVVLDFTLSYTIKT